MIFLFANVLLECILLVCKNMSFSLRKLFGFFMESSFGLLFPWRQVPRFGLHPLFCHLLITSLCAPLTYTLLCDYVFAFYYAFPSLCFLCFLICGLFYPVGLWILYYNICCFWCRLLVPQPSCCVITMMPTIKDTLSLRTCVLPQITR